jgi:uncharacterized protein YjbJ (UPF0337 family)
LPPALGGLPPALGGLPPALGGLPPAGDRVTQSCPRVKEREQMSGGTFDDAKGRVKEAAGDLTDDKSLKNEGKVDKATGKVKDAVEGTADKVKDVVNPND